MEKLIYLIGHEGDPVGLRETLIGETGKALLSKGVYELEIYVRDQTDPIVESLENNMDPEGWMSACVSLWISSSDDRQPIEGILREITPRLAGYLVTESVPREYDRRCWPDGTTSPGVTIGTAFVEKQGLALADFYRRWHESHTPLSLRIHPLTRYIRNAVARVLTPSAPAYRALVFESVDSLSTLADLDLWYGSPAGRVEAVRDLLGFADYASMASVTMSETILKAAPWRQAEGGNQK
jgi:hypothetical protein